MTIKKETNQMILRAINEKGWNLYCRGAPRTKIDVMATIQRGPVDALEFGILYDILPRVSRSTDKDLIDSFIKKHKIVPKVLVPKDGFPYFGRVVAEFSGGDEEEFFLHPCEEVNFIGIELQEKEVRLLAPSRTYMPYSVFQKALEVLQDITGLKEPKPRKKGKE